MNFDIPTATELAQIVKDNNLTHKELGEAIGYSDAERTARALIKGERHQKPYVISGPAVSSLRYLLALAKLSKAHRNYQDDQTADNEERLATALDEAVAILPKRMRT